MISGSLGFAVAPARLDLGTPTRVENTWKWRRCKAANWKAPFKMPGISCCPATAKMLNPGREKAAFHEIRARHYHRQARLLLERDQDPDCAAIVLYEAAAAIAEFARKL